MRLFALAVLLGSGCSVEAIPPGSTVMKPVVSWNERPPSVAPGPVIVPGTESPWTSPAACEAALAGTSGGPPGTIRIATWNVRWFPLGHAPFDATATGPATDVVWMTCILASMHADFIVLEEVLTSPAAQTALATLVDGLSERQATTWRSVILDCPDPDLQHIALLYRADASVSVEATTLRLSGAGEALCSASQRPALRARIDRDGAPITITGVHLKSGRDARSYGLRRESMGLLVAATVAEPTGRTVIALGDLNSMGCSDCTDPSTGAEEVAVLDAEWTAAGMSRAQPEHGCSEYNGTRPGLLDHIVVRGRPELAAHVDGTCRERACAKLGFGDEPLALETLSDHCPLWVDVPGVP